MSERSHRDYLQEVLALDPRIEADVILRQRSQFLQPDDILMAEAADGESADDDLRSRVLKRVNALRHNFWSLDDDELASQISSLQNLRLAETDAVVARLRQVADLRDSLCRLHEDPGVHPNFFVALAKILIAPQAEANRLRDRQTSWIRPESNRNYKSAWKSVRKSARVIRSRYPQVFKLEESWLTELLEYNPKEETENETGNLIVGLALLGGVGLLLFVLKFCVSWVFS